MEKYDALSLLGQVEIEEAGEVFRDLLRGVVRETILGVMAREVETLCGPAYYPDSTTDHTRAGSAAGSVLVEGRREEVQRPRVRRRKADGSTEEADLVSCRTAREPGELHAMLLRALAGGVSTRDQKRVYPESPGASKSNVSRLFVNEGGRLFEEFRARDIVRDDWLILMLDGVRLAEEMWAIVALGVAGDGTKYMLDFEVGASESAEVATALLSRLVDRGFAPKVGCRLLCVLDGAKALKTAVKKHWPSAVIQRCLVHKERNLKGYLSKRDWAELARLMTRLRKVQGAEAGRKALADLRSFLAGRNAEATASLDEAGDELIALHLLEVPNTLHVNLLSTNAIENSIGNIRRKIGRVTRWRVETDQARRWLALALTEAEKGFRKISGYLDLPALAHALAQKSEETGAMP